MAASSAAADKGFVRARCNTDLPPMDAIISSAKNKFKSLEIEYLSGEASTEGSPSGQAPFKHSCYDFVGGTVPDNTDYPDSIAPIGSTFLRLVVTSEVITGAELYIKTAAGTWNLFSEPAQDGITVVDVEVSSAELLALNATPKEIIPAPGAGLINVLVDAQLFLDYATTDYDGIAAGEDLAFKYTDDSGAVLSTVETTGFLDASADAHRIVHAQEAAYAPVANAAIVLHLLTDEIATGDSPLKVRARYKTLPLQT